MENYLKLSLGFALLLILFSCKKEDDPLTSIESKSGLSYVESLDKWNKLKELNGNSYTFQIEFFSWTGQGSVTELKVKNGEVIGRTYEEIITKYPNGEVELEIIDSYSESIADLGSHERGAALVSIDDLYKSCAKKYLVVDSKKNRIYFETETNGMMRLCGFYPEGCVDDCYSGVSISSFKWID